MQKLHIGRGTTRGALTVFPIWAPFTSTIAVSQRLRVREVSDGPVVGQVELVNDDPHPVLVMEGQVVEGGWQNRMVARSLAVGRFGVEVADVVCVEQGRWDGGADHRADGRRGSPRVRAGLRSAIDRQGAVWSRVRDYEASRGTTATQSFTEHADRALDRTEALTRDLHPLPGQVGVLIGLAGQPIGAEVFGNDRLLLSELDSILRAAALDALDLPPIPTPSRRALRFLDRAAAVTLHRGGSAGIGESVEGASQYVQVTGLDVDDAPAHRVLTNPRHELSLASA